MFSFQLLGCIRKDGWKYPSDTEWWHTLRDKIAANAKITKVYFPLRSLWNHSSICSMLIVSFIITLPFCYPQALSLQSTVPMNYYTVFHHISQLLPHDCIIVSEGANTMDIGRTMLNNYLPRHRLGTFTGAAPHQDLLLFYHSVWKYTFYRGFRAKV